VRFSFSARYEMFLSFLQRRYGFAVCYNANHARVSVSDLGNVRVFSTSRARLGARENRKNSFRVWQNGRVKYGTYLFLFENVIRVGKSCGALSELPDRLNANNTRTRRIHRSGKNSTINGQFYFVDAHAEQFRRISPPERRSK